MLASELRLSERDTVTAMVETGEARQSGMPRPREERMAGLLLLGLALLLSPNPTEDEPIEDLNRGAVKSLDEFALAF